MTECLGDGTSHERFDATGVHRLGTDTHDDCNPEEVGLGLGEEKGVDVVCESFNALRSNSLSRLVSDGFEGARISLTSTLSIC